MHISCACVWSNSLSDAVLSIDFFGGASLLRVCFRCFDFSKLSCALRAPALALVVRPPRGAAAACASVDDDGDDDDGWSGAVAAAVVVISGLPDDSTGATAKELPHPIA
jgi:hypothetical protein